MNEMELLTNIMEQVTCINHFLQLLIYGLALIIFIYFGYWFFSRFFY